MSQNEKIINTIRNSKPPIQDEIEEWQSFETNEQMHVKYEPNSTSSKNHLDAILADVNEDSKNVEEFLNRNLISDLIGNEFKVDYQNFSEDPETSNNDIDVNNLMEKAKTFFKRNGLLLNWVEFEKLDQAQRINTLAMIAPISNEEKQKLLEAISIQNKVKTLESIISFYLYETGSNNQTIQ